MLNIPPFFTFGRLRVVHTNGLAFGLGIGAIFGISYYIVMRLTKRPLLFPKLARFHLYLFNAAIVLAALSLLAGMNQSLEYAELRRPSTPEAGAQALLVYQALADILSGESAGIALEAAQQRAQK